MKKVSALVVLLAVMGLVLASVAYAADEAAKPAPAPAAKAAPAPAAKAAPAPAAKAAPAPAGKVAPAGMKCEVTGKVESKTAKNKKGVEVKHVQIVVSEAKGADGKPVAALKGKTLGVVGAKKADVEKLMGKDVTVTGKVVNEKRIEVESVK